MSRDDAMTREEAIYGVLEGLQALILMAARNAAREQYSPSQDVDASDDAIAEGKADMAKLRQIRADFETLITGVIP